MGVIFKIGEHEDYPPVPENFPTCGDWFSSNIKSVDLNSTIPQTNAKLPIHLEQTPEVVIENELLALSRIASLFIHSRESGNLETAPVDASSAISLPISQKCNSLLWCSAVVVMCFSILYAQL